MSAPDLAKATAFLAARPPPGRLLLCGITGSHHYGFTSPDSDIDIKAIHLAPTTSVLGLSPPPETHDALEWFEGTECDLTSHEAAKAFGLLLRGNGNLLERVFSPFQIAQTDALDPLRGLARDALSKASFGHYSGYFRGMQREHTKHLDAKSLLYSYRVALTGTHLLLTGEVVAHLPTLAPRYGFDSITEIIDFKVSTAEHAVLSVADSERHTARWPELTALLDDALARSPLPPEAPNREAVDAWLVDRRLEYLA
jgi:predicted nucleotidyltransferase